MGCFRRNDINEYWVTLCGGVMDTSTAETFIKEGFGSC